MVEQVPRGGILPWLPRRLGLHQGNQLATNLREGKHK